MRTTISIADELLESAKARAKERGKTLGQLVEDGLRRELAVELRVRGATTRADLSGRHRPQAGRRPHFEPRSSTDFSTKESRSRSCVEGAAARRQRGRRRAPRRPRAATRRRAHWFEGILRRDGAVLGAHSSFGRRSCDSPPAGASSIAPTPLKEPSRFVSATCAQPHHVLLRAGPARTWSCSRRSAWRPMRPATSSRTPSSRRSRWSTAAVGRLHGSRLRPLPVDRVRRAGGAERR